MGWPRRMMASTQRPNWTANRSTSPGSGGDGSRRGSSHFCSRGSPARTKRGAATATDVRRTKRRSGGALRVGVLSGRWVSASALDDKPGSGKALQKLAGIGDRHLRGDVVLGTQDL